MPIKNATLGIRPLHSPNGDPLDAYWSTFWSFETAGGGRYGDHVRSTDLANLAVDPLVRQMWQEQFEQALNVAYQLGYEDGQK